MTDHGQFNDVEAVFGEWTRDADATHPARSERNPNVKVERAGEMALVVASKNVSAAVVRCAVTSNCKTIVDCSYIRQPPLLATAGPAQSMTFCASDQDGAGRRQPCEGRTLPPHRSSGHFFVPIQLDNSPK